MAILTLPLLLSAIAAPPSPLPQACGSDLPLPSSSMARVGETVSVSSTRVISSEWLEPEILVWDRSGTTPTFETALVSASGQDVLYVDADGDRIAVVSIVTNSVYSLTVWERAATGAWAQSAPLELTLPGGMWIEGPVALEGDMLACRSGGGGSSLAIFERNPQLGTWSFTEGVPNPSNSSLGYTLRLENGRLITSSGSFSNQDILVMERSSGVFTLEATLQGNQYDQRFDASGDRIAIPGYSLVDVWHRGPSGWSLEQRLDGPLARGAQRVGLGENTLLLSVNLPSQGKPIAVPIRVFGRTTGSSTWLAKESLSPPGGFDGATDAWGINLCVEGDLLAVSDAGFGLSGRVSAFDASCLVSPPVLHWTPSTLGISSTAGWPENGETLTVQTPLPFDPGAPFGMRDAVLNVVGDYVLDVQGRPCTQDYGTNVCAYAAFNFTDSVSGQSTNPYPIDPLSGFPQLFSAGPGPLVLASATNVQIPWPFVFEATGTTDRDLVAAAVPMNIRLEAQIYNCVDTGGIWAPDVPNVEAFSCGYEVLPVSVTSVDFSASVEASLAFEFPPLPPAVQGVVCDGGVNGSGARAELTAVGSSNLADNGLFFDVTGLIPGAAGILFLSPQAATAPFAPLGFGSLCLAAPITRVPGSLGIADGYGHAALQLDLATLPSFAQPQPGETWAAQWMYRDQGFVNTTSARTVLFQ